MESSDVNSLLRRYMKGDAIEAKDLSIYRRAMVHRSCPSKKTYERLEFLGDAVLNLAAASYLYERYPGEDEGFMTRMRTQLINGKMLADLCMRHTSLPKFIMVGGELRKTACALSYDVLEDVFEAFLGAIFLDLGFETAKRWLIGVMETNIDFSELAAKQDGPKSKLNRFCMRKFNYVPKIEDLEGGGVRITSPDGAVIATGMAGDRKAAEAIAVKKALEYFGWGASPPPPRLTP